MPITIASRKNGLRMYYVDDRVINQINFYKNGEVVLATRSGWIENNNGRDMPGITLINDVVRRTKLNLTKGGHFYIATAKTGFDKKPEVALYIDLALECNVGDEEIAELYADSGSVTYHKVRRLTAYFGDHTFASIVIVPMVGTVFTVKNNYGDKLATIQDRLTKIGATVTNLQALIEDQELHTLLTEASIMFKNAKAS